MVSNFSMKRWAPDGESNYCSDCYEKFTILNRKHHCRGCGRLLCHSCSNHWLLIPEDKVVTVDSRQEELKIPQRCCNSCANYLQIYQVDLRKLLSRANEDLGIDRDSTQRYMNNPLSLQLQTDIRKATYTLYNFTSDNKIQGKDKIPKELILNAKGIVFLTIMKAGFLLSARVGTGLVLNRLEDGSWSAPSAISISGFGWGFQIGGELTDVILILNTQSAVNAFSSNTQISLGTELGVSIGTDMHAGENGASAAFSYAHSKGLFAGISLEASVITTRSDVNRQFYGISILASDLLNGKEPKPKAAEPLYQALTEVLGKLTELDEESMSYSDREEEEDNCQYSQYHDQEYLTTTAIMSLTPDDSYMNSGSIQDRNERLRKSKDSEHMYDRSSSSNIVTTKDKSYSSGSSIINKQQQQQHATNVSNSSSKSISTKDITSEDNYFDHIYEFDSNMKTSKSNVHSTTINTVNTSVSNAEFDRNSAYTSFSDINTSLST